MLLGAHVSISGAIHLAVDRAVELGCTTFQIFTRNPRGWTYTKLKQQDVDEFNRKFENAGFKVAMAHMPYLPNIASPKKLIYDKSVKSLTAELERCGLLGVELLVVHIGSHLGAGIGKGVELVANAVNQALEKVDNKVLVLLENMAGQKNSCGSKFQDIAQILSRIERQSRVGVCLDTCHLLAAGYDIRSKEAVEATLKEFDRVVGLDRLKAVHLNDSKGGLGSGLDRHEHIGMGSIGVQGFKAFINHPAIRDKPMVIETPEDEKGNYMTDLKKLRTLYAA
ncbi:MAG: deoxyribonuclease IV [Candidatus Caldarchaeum sp.]|nr:deoxyribonuclease IV [Candidatus Caldarchaeum sp.]MDW8358961.1 deoxyribonuclease IV [Candidatus Caldarchaeum sp.]